MFTTKDFGQVPGRCTYQQVLESTCLKLNLQDLSTVKRWSRIQSTFERHCFSHPCCTSSHLSGLCGIWLKKHSPLGVGDWRSAQTAGSSAPPTAVERCFPEPLVTPSLHSAVSHYFQQLQWFATAPACVCPILFALWRITCTHSAAEGSHFHFSPIRAYRFLRVFSSAITEQRKLTRSMSGGSRFQGHRTGSLFV